RFPEMFYRSSRVRFTRRCTGWSEEAGSKQVGVNQKRPAGEVLQTVSERPKAIDERGIELAAARRGSNGHYANGGVGLMRLFKFFLRKSAVEKELDSEIRFHLDSVIQEKIVAGLSPEEA